MAAVPGHEVVAFVVRRHREVERIPSRIGWHHLIPDVGCDDLEDLRLDRKQGEVTQKLQSWPSVLRLPSRQLVDHRWKSDQLVTRKGRFPPRACPSSANLNVRRCPGGVVEARDRRFDVDTLLGHGARITQISWRNSASRDSGRNPRNGTWGWSNRREVGWAGRGRAFERPAAQPYSTSGRSMSTSWGKRSVSCMIRRPGICGRRRSLVRKVVHLAVTAAATWRESGVLSR